VGPRWLARGEQRADVVEVDAHPQRLGVAGAGCAPEARDEAVVTEVVIRAVAQLARPGRRGDEQQDHDQDVPHLVLTPRWRRLFPRALKSRKRIRDERSVLA